MKRYVLTALVLAAVPVLVLAASADVQLLKQARSQVALLSGELKQRVVKQVGDKGPENALASCRLQVEGIIDRLTNDGGWEIRRTSFRVRNPNNAPDEWERRILSMFEKREQEGVDLKTYEYAEVISMDGKRVFRYMKPIVMQEFCTLCHGDSLSPALAARIEKNYPDDRAVGFKPGQLRGAFSLLRVLPGDPP